MDKSNMKSFFEDQMLTMGIMNGNNNSFINMVIGLAIMKVIEFLCVFVPIVVREVDTRINNFFKKKAMEHNVVVYDKKNTIIKFMYHYENSNSKIESVIDYINGRNEALKLIFSSSYIIDNIDDFELGYRDVKCKVLNYEISEKGVLEKLNFIIYSETLPLDKLKEWINDIENEYIFQLNNALGNKLYYFEDISTKSNVTKSGYMVDVRSELLFSSTLFQTNKSLVNLFGPEIDLIKNRIDTFVNNREWYEKRGIPYTLGILLHGTPGSGKTSSIKAIAKDTNRHIINVRLNKYTTKTQLRNLFLSESLAVMGEQKVHYNIPISKRLYVFEEIDTVENLFTDRKLVTNSEEEEEEIKDKLDIGFMLELLDGVLETPSRIFIMTTNHPEILDPAILRPGRIDVNVKFGYLSNQTLSQLFEFFYNIRHEFGKELDGVFTAAQAICIMAENRETPINAISKIESSLVVSDTSL